MRIETYKAKNLKLWLETEKEVNLMDIDQLKEYAIKHLISTEKVYNRKMKFDLRNRGGKN
ncbi:MAG: hypothetical protein R3Y64_08800 [Peptostreptococcaceae bacterium]